MIWQFDEKRENGVFSLSDKTSFKKFKEGDPFLYRILWARSGKASFNVDSIPCEIKKNQIAFFTPHNLVDKIVESGDLISFAFNREFYCIRDHDHEVSCHGYLFYGSSTVPIITLSEKECQSFETLLLVFLEEFETQDNIQGEMLRMLLKQLLIKSTRLGKKLLNNPIIKDTQLDVIRKYNVLVEQHFRQMHKVKDYASLLAKSPKTLANLFTQYNDQTPLQVIHERIILEAKRLLVSSDKTIDEITFELGFNEAPHFSRFFKKQSGQNPTEFRKQKKGS